MANLPEQATWAPGVFQLETDTPVQGGPEGASNRPLRNLADRTAWLKAQVEALGQGGEGLAPINSPDFTGAPQTPDVALGDRSRRIPNTKFVQDTVGGITERSIGGQGNFVLSAIEAGRGILLLTGALTGNANVILPTSPTRNWLVLNRTTGNFAVTLKTLEGTGVTVSQGKNASVANHAGNIVRSFTDFRDITLEGTALAPTPPEAADDQRIATTQWANRRGMKYAWGGNLQGMHTLAADKVGHLFYVGTGGANITLPLASQCKPGDTLTFHMLEDVYSFFNSQGGDLLKAGGNFYNTLNVKRGSFIFFTLTLGGFWAVGGDAGHPFTKGGFSTWGENGNAQNANGNLENWGFSPIINPGESSIITFSLAYPTAVVGIHPQFVGNNGGAGPAQVHSVTLTQFQLRNGGGVAGRFFWRALGY